MTAIYNYFFTPSQNQAPSQSTSWFSASTIKKVCAVFLGFLLASQGATTARAENRLVLPNVGTALTPYEPHPFSMGQCPAISPLPGPGISALDPIDEVLTSPRSDAEKVDTLQDIAYNTLAHGVGSKNRHLQVLQILLCSDNPKPSDVAAVIKSAQKQLGSPPQQRPKSTQSVAAHYPTWDEGKRGIGPNTMVTISHGGGALYLNKFLNGESSGYVSEARGQGIFVTTEDSMRNRDWGYATLKPRKYFDTPAVLRGQIAAKYLHQVNHNSYEAVLLPENVKHLKVTSLKKRSMRNLPLRNRRPFCQQGLPPAQFGPRGPNFNPTLWDHVKSSYTPEQMTRMKRALNSLL